MNVLRPPHHRSRLDSRGWWQHMPDRRTSFSLAFAALLVLGACGVVEERGRTLSASEPAQRSLPSRSADGRSALSRGRPNRAR